MSDYYFILGKKNSQKQFMETFEAAKLDLGINALKSEVETLLCKVSELEEIVGSDNIIEHYKKQFQDLLRNGSCRRSDLVSGPFYWHKNRALEQLFQEDKLVRAKTGGWIKLRSEKET